MDNTCTKSLWIKCDVGEYQIFTTAGASSGTEQENETTGVRINGIKDATDSVAQYRQSVVDTKKQKSTTGVHAH